MAPSEVDSDKLSTNPDSRNITHRCYGLLIAMLNLHTIVAAFCLSPLLLAAQPPARISFYVSPTGDDHNSGTDARPFATLTAARAAVRMAKSKPHATGAITVWLHGGLYLLDQSFKLSKEDSGSASDPIVYRAVPGEVPRIVGGARLDAKMLKPVPNGEHIAPEARGRTFQMPLPAALAHVDRYPNLFHGNGGLFQLLLDDHILPLSRWPDNGYTTMASVLESGITPSAGGTFVYRDEVSAHAQRWAEAAKAGRLWLTGFWRVPFEVNSIRVASIDTSNKTITFAAPAPGGIGSKYVDTINGTRHGSGKEQYYAFNLVEEIDRPGEWAYDFDAKILSFWPPVSDDLLDRELLIANLSAPVIQLDGASFVTLRGLTIEGGLKEGVQINGGQSNLIAGCTLRNIGGGGIDIEGGDENKAQSNDLLHLGSYGIRLVAGDRKTLTPGKATADNNHISFIGEQERITEGIYLSGIGNSATHNLIHDAPYNGINYQGNDQLMSFNEIHHIGLDAGDLGIFYTNGDWAAQGNLIQYNFGHNAPNANGSYIDDGASGRSTLGNIFYKIGSGIFLGGGHNNHVEGNIFIETRLGIHVDNRGVARKYDATAHHLTQFLNTINPNAPPWSTRYPDFLKGITEDPTQPTNNTFTGNAIVGAIKPYEVSALAVVDPKTNPTITGDPRFANATTMDFTLRPDSPIFTAIPGFKPIPLSMIGLYLDAYRARLPTAEETGRFTDRTELQRFESNTDVKASDKIGTAKP